MSAAAASAASPAAAGAVAKGNLLAFDERSLSFIVHQLKGYYFISTKKTVFDTLLASGVSSTNSGIRVSINRMKASKSRENPQKDPFGNQLRRFAPRTHACCLHALVVLVSMTCICVLFSQA